MARWLRQLKLKDIYTRYLDDGLSVQEVAREVATRIQNIRHFNDEDIDSEKENIIENFQDLAEDQDTEAEDFDREMCGLYDWGDQALTEGAVGRVCWIETM